MSSEDRTHGRCIADAARCEAWCSPRQRRRCTADVDDGAIIRPQLPGTLSGRHLQLAPEERYSSEDLGLAALEEEKEKEEAEE
eukprot:3140156-Pyramimonas_sp.AAC.1